MKNKKLLGYYDYTVVLTYTGMLCAFTAILCAINCSFLNSIVFLLLAGVCDMFDGAVASTKERDKSEKRFGIQIDSLSDLISFGVMPAVFSYMISDRDFLSAIISGLFLLAALIRLAYFNVIEEERQDVETGKRTVFFGVPVTTISILLPIVYLFESDGIFHSKVPYLVLLALCGTGFLLPIQLKKPNLVGKICLIILGIIEALGIFFLGWDLV